MSVNNKKDVDFLENRLRDNPNSMLFARLADIYLKMSRVDEAIALCESGAKKHPYYATGHFVLGKGYLANKMYEQAEKEFKRVLLFDPKFLSAHKLYGDLMKEIGWENTCEMSYRKILQIDPLEEVAQAYVGEQDLETVIMPREEPSTPEPAEPEPAATDQDAWPYQAPVKSGEESSPQNMPDPFAATEMEPDFEKNAGEPTQPANPAPQWPAEPQQKPHSPPRSEMQTNQGFDPDAVSPMPVTPEEEDLLFQEPKKSEPSFEHPAQQVSPIEPELDEKKAEEFSYILDDIFKEDADDSQGIPHHPATSEISDTMEQNSEESEDDPDDFLAELQLSQPEPEETLPPADLTPPDANIPLAEVVTEREVVPSDNVPMKPPTVVDESEPYEQTTETESKKPAPPQVKIPKRKKHGEKIVTPTLGEIYAAQGQYGKAIDVFETLIKKHPDNEFYQKKIEVLRNKLAEVNDASQN